VFVISLVLALGISFASAQNASSNYDGQKQASSLPPGPVLGGDGTPNYIPLWRTADYLQNSLLYQSGGSIGLGTTNPQATLDVNGSMNVASYYAIGGSQTLASDPSNYNLFVGYEAGINNASGAQNNTFVGAAAGRSNTTGYYNSFCGSGSGIVNTSGYDDSFFGTSAGASNSTGNDNTFAGDFAGEGNTTGAFNLFLGSGAGYNNTTGSSNIYIGHPGLAFRNESNTIRIGYQGVGNGEQSVTYIAGIYGNISSSSLPVFVNSLGQLGTQSSSLRFKERVQDMGGSTDRLMSLRPVTFFYKPDYADGERNLQYGLIAEEVAKVYPELVTYDSEGKPYSVRYQYLSTMLLNEVQKQYRRAEAEATTIKSQEGKINDLEQRLERLERLVGAQASIVQTDSPTP
jgi:hypothetical protein